MSALSPQIAVKFCELCEWAHTVWSVHRGFEDDPRLHDPAVRRHEYFFRNFSLMSTEYLLLQMAKLHDPACQQGRLNLTLEYLLQYGGWDPATLVELSDMIAELTVLYDQIRRARNRLIAHNDLATLLGSQDLGQFPAGADDKYFGTLMRLASTVHTAVVGTPFAFGPQPYTDAGHLLAALTRPDTAILARN